MPVSARDIGSCFSVSLVFVRAMVAPRPRWADVSDSSDAGSEAGVFSPTPPAPASVRALPFHYVLGAYLRGLLDCSVSSASLGALQRLLRADDRGRALPAGFLRDLIWSLTFDEGRAWIAVGAYVDAVHAGRFTAATLRTWQAFVQIQVLQIRSLPVPVWYVYVFFLCFVP